MEITTKAEHCKFLSFFHLFLTNYMEALVTNSREPLMRSWGPRNFVVGWQPLFWELLGQETQLKFLSYSNIHFFIHYLVAQES